MVCCMLQPDVALKFVTLSGSEGTTVVIITLGSEVTTVGIITLVITTAVVTLGSEVTTVVIITLVVTSAVVTSVPLRVIEVTRPQINERKKVRLVDKSCCKQAVFFV